MVIPTLDKAVRTALNSLTAEEVSREVSYAYEHEILWYGIHAVAHVHLMRMAESIAHSRFRIPDEELIQNREEFIQKYGLSFKEGEGYGFSGPLKNIERDGIFIPQQVYRRRVNQKRQRYRIRFFAHDYNNRINCDSWSDKRYARALTYGKIWQPSDLDNHILIELGIQFGRDMWKTCVDGFHEYKKGMSGAGIILPQPKKVTDLAEKLMAYYSAIIAEPTDTEKYHPDYLERTYGKR
ncbi:hypothetical protein HZC30_01240 [Candidatus Woesearchaeota archaeon]|nr:hypothetical protein [Candidatus Woesearchaeota archaeon]